MKSLRELAKEKGLDLSKIEHGERELDEWIPAAAKRLQALHDNWDNEDSLERKQFDATKEKWDKIMAPLIETIESSEMLTGEDMATRINTRS